jgi:putative membrane protein
MKATPFGSRRFLKLGICGLALAGLVGCGQDSRSPEGNRLVEDSSESASPQAILQKLHWSNQHEIALCDIAASRGSSAEVKDYAAKIRADHEAADKRVMDVASQLSLNLTSEDSPNSRDHADRVRSSLESLEGEAFDQAFVQEMVSGHDKTIAELTALQPQVSQAEVKSLLDELLPTLQGHLQQGRDLMAGYSSDTSADSMGKGKDQTQKQSPVADKPAEQGKDVPADKPQAPKDQLQKQDNKTPDTPVIQGQKKPETPVEQKKPDTPVEQKKPETPVTQEQKKPETPIVQKQQKTPEKPVEQKQENKPVQGDDKKDSGQRPGGSQAA